jgi:hypothetical protein
MRILVALAVLAWSMSAVAEEPEVIYKRHTVVVFGDDTVDGRLDKADLGYIESRKDVRHESLIQPRASFRAEILRSVRGF